METEFFSNGVAWIYALVNLERMFISVVPFILFVVWLLDVHCYTFNSKETQSLICNFMKNDISMQKDEDGRPCSVVLHRALLPRYIMYRSQWDRSLYIYTTTHYLNNVIMKQSNHTEKANIETKPKKKLVEDIPKVRLIIRKGDQGYAGYRARDVFITPYVFTKQQSKMFCEITKFYNKHNYAKVLITGKMHTGKTCFAYLLARELRTCICTTFNPTNPSDSLDNLYLNVEHTVDEPIILVLDEVDGILSHITQGVEPHKQFLISVRNKHDWNEMLDRIELGIYPDLILIMISNKTEEELSLYDSSYLRQGRVNLRYTLTDTIMAS